MALFQTYKDTVFVRNSNRLQKKLESLQAIYDRTNQKDKLEQEIEITKQQLAVENQIEYILKNSSIGMVVVKDLYIKYGDQEDLIDYCIITPAHCYLIACKNMIGNLTINSSGEFFREYSVNGKVVNEKIYSPYLTAMRHKDLLKKLWEKNNNFIMASLGAANFEEYYQPLIIYGYPEGKINAASAPMHIKSMFTISSRMLNYFQKAVDAKDLLSRDSESKMHDKASQLVNMHVERFEDFTEGYVVEAIKREVTVDTTDLLDRLTSYRNLKARLMNIQPTEVFTDMQLSQLMQLIPTDIITLQGSYILEPFKLELHGAEIISIMNGATYRLPELGKGNTLEEKQATKKKEEETILSPEMVLQVEAFSKQIDIKNSAITTNYGAGSLNKVTPTLTSLDHSIQLSINGLQNNIQEIKGLKNVTSMNTVELYMYLSAGKKALENSKKNEQPILQANLENKPGIANELAMSSYNTSLANMEKQMERLERAYKQLSKYNKAIDALLTKQQELLQEVQNILDE